jgi:hypothetical protein
MSDQSIPAGFCQCGCGQRTKTTKQAIPARGLAKGQPYPTKPGHYPRPSSSERFSRRVDTSGDCWVWTGPMTRHGYGRFYVNGAEHPAHRWIYEEILGPLPKGLLVCHRCDNPACVRVSHLFSGTAKENTEDMIAKGRDNFGRRVYVHLGTH